METKDLNTIIKDLKDQLDGVIIVGKFYKSWNGHIIKCTGETSGYGVNSCGEWEKSNYWSFKTCRTDWVEVSLEEWEEALLNYAEKKYKDCTSVDRTNLHDLSSYHKKVVPFKESRREGNNIYHEGWYRYKGAFVMDPSGVWAKGIK